MSDEKSDDIDVKMYVTFSCVDCGRKELEDHESSH
jgi:predicted nucleic-acid-binding Zn-ribbon protein